MVSSRTAVTQSLTLCPSHSRTYSLSHSHTPTHTLSLSLFAGLFFQWVMCCSILFSGIILYIIQCRTYTDALGQTVCPTFQPLAMLGGMLWCLGNVWVVAIVKTIGLAVGLCLWGCGNLLMGWASGRFGLFGLKEQVPQNSALNYAGVVVAVVATVSFFFIRSTLKERPSSGGYIQKTVNVTNDERALLRYNDSLSARPGLSSSSSSPYTVEKLEPLSVERNNGVDDEDDRMWTDNLSPMGKKIFGITAAVCSGFLYGVNFDPPQYIVDHRESFPGASSEMLYYVFPHFCGIFCTSTLVLLGYTIRQKNMPVVYPEIVLPGFLSGTVWSIAQICWFIANSKLSSAVASPRSLDACISCMKPSCFLFEYLGCSSLSHIRSLPLAPAWSVCCGAHWSSAKSLECATICSWLFRSLWSSHPQ